MTESLIRLLDWDTAFFGVRIARINQVTLTPSEASLVDAWCTREHIDCVYFLAEDEAQTVRTAEQNAYEFRDIRLTFGLSLAGEAVPMPAVPRGMVIRSAALGDLKALEPFVVNTFTHSRFYRDPHFSQERCDELYRVWLERSIRSEIADAAFVLEFESNPAAYITLETSSEKDTAAIGLLGVSPRLYGRGVGQLLVQQAQAVCQQRGFGKMTVVTQGRNIAAQRLYQKAGFRTVDMKLWYHKWYAPAG